MIYSHQWNISSMTSQCHIVKMSKCLPIIFHVLSANVDRLINTFSWPYSHIWNILFFKFHEPKKSFSQRSNILFIVLHVPIGKYQDWLILFHIPVVKYQWLINFISHPCRQISVTNIPLGKYQPLIRDISDHPRQISVTHSWYFISL